MCIRDRLWRVEDGAVGADSAADHVVALADGGVVAAGQTLDRQTGAGRLWLWRIGASGETLWRRDIAQTAQLQAVGGLAATDDALLLAVNASGDAAAARVALFEIPLDAPRSP